MIKSMSREELVGRNVLYTDSIGEAFDQYPSRVISGSKEELYQFLRCVLEKNKEKAYADFYYGDLPRENKTKFDEGLSDRERETLSQFEIEPKREFYPLTEDNLEFLAEITAREWLFSTFYFGDKELTIWGNYGLKYPVFSSDEGILLEYMQLAEECGLEIRE